MNRLKPPDERRPHNYILDEGGKPVPLDHDFGENLLKWARWMQEHDKDRIVEQEKVEGILISTVFLGIDHNFGFQSDPVLWETMIFDERPEGERYRPDLYQERYTSVEAAREGHARAVAAVKAGRTHGRTN